MSNNDLLWTEQQRAAAQAEGWDLAFVVNEGKPVASAYLDIFDIGPQFGTRNDAMKFVIARAQERSKLHITALSACSLSRLNATTATKPRRKKA